MQPSPPGPRVTRSRATLLAILREQRAKIEELESVNVRILSELAALREKQREPGRA